MGWRLITDADLRFPQDGDCESVAEVTVRPSEKRAGPLAGSRGPHAFWPPNWGWRKPLATRFPSLRVVRVMHITYGDKAVFVDDETAGVLFDYAAFLADSGRADTVDLNAVGPDGHTVVVTYLLDQGLYPGKRVRRRDSPYSG